MTDVKTFITSLAIQENENSHLHTFFQSNALGDYSGVVVFECQAEPVEAQAQ